MMVKHRKQDILVIVFALILLIIIFSIALLTFNSPTTTTVVPSPTPPLVISQPPQVIYDSGSGARLADKIIHRQTLSSQDATTKTATLNTILQGNNSGVVFQNSDVRVEYVQSVDLFMADILTTNINQAKIETVNWFMSKGFSHQAVCDLPVMFYLDSSVSAALQINIRFSPLAEGC